VVQGGTPPRIELGSFMGDCAEQVVTWSPTPVAKSSCVWAGAFSHIAVIQTSPTEIMVKHRDDDAQVALTTKFPERVLGRSTVAAGSKIVLDR